jgi:[NiFe] hydrogenase diaphorase moiety large subunit
MKDKISIEKAIERELGIKFGETTKDKKITIEFTNCIGLCDEGPAMSINNRVYTKLTSEKAIEIINQVK